MRLVKAGRKVTDVKNGPPSALATWFPPLPRWVLSTVTSHWVPSSQGHLRDQYGHLVNVYTKLLLTKISFHLKVVELWG